tara:strand:+ start:602 stop:823 length:222 start_codon:yes stop_codon:yes gene_type:complete
VHYANINYYHVVKEVKKMIEQKYFDNLKLLETEIQVAIWEHEKNHAPQVIINEMKEALNHISKAIDILEWDEL